MTGVDEAVGVGVVGVVGGCEHTALSATAFGIHSATYNSCNSVVGSDRPNASMYIRTYVRTYA